MKIKVAVYRSVKYDFISVFETRPAVMVADFTDKLAAIDRRKAELLALPAPGAP